MDTVHLGILTVTDKTTGQAAVAIALHQESFVFVGGFTSPDGEPLEFRGPSGGVKPWAIRNGFEYECHAIEVDLESRQLIDWKTFN